MGRILKVYSKTFMSSNLDFRKNSGCHVKTQWDWVEGVCGRDNSESRKTREKFGT